MEALFGALERFSRMPVVDKLVNNVVRRLAPHEEVVACNDCLKWVEPCNGTYVRYAYGDLQYFGGCPGGGEGCGGGATPYCVPPWCYVDVPCA